jgi:DNA-binding transcriptional LysR family regulator
MSTGFQPAELSFIVALSTAGSLSGAGASLGITTSAVSKRLAFIESRVGVPLVNRTTRRMSLTPEGEVLLEHARRILGEIADLDQLLTNSKGVPKGQLRVNATLGFGRLHIAPAISRVLDIRKWMCSYSCQSIRRRWQTTSSTFASASVHRLIRA